MSDLQSTFERLGFQEYLTPLLEHGFDTWDNLAGINEEDMAAIGIKLGHRRRLQQETARQLGHHAKEQLSGLEVGIPHMGGQHNNKAINITHLDRPKRRYRRRPPRDSKAPPRPDTAYVAYTRSLRQEPEVAKLSFVEIAKVVGERWSHLESNEKEIWSQDAAAQRSVYKSELAQYHKSAAYQAHHDYSGSKKPRNDQWEPEVDYNNALTKEFCANHISGRLSNMGNMKDEISTNSLERTYYEVSESARSSSIASVLTPHVINNTDTRWSPNSRYSSSPATSVCESNKLDVDGSAFDKITTITPQDRFSKAASLALPPNPDKILPHIFQCSAVSRSFHTQTINPFNFQTREMTLPIIDGFLQNVNTVYYLVDPDELRKNLGSVLDTSQETHNLIMSIVCLCLALGHQNCAMGMADTAIMWYENGRRYLDDCDWHRDLAVMQALALISIFHIAQRPATSSHYLDNAIRIGEANDLHKAAGAERHNQTSDCGDDDDWPHIWGTMQTMYRYHLSTSLSQDFSG